MENYYSGETLHIVGNTVFVHSGETNLKNRRLVLWFWFSCSLDDKFQGKKQDDLMCACTVCILNMLLLSPAGQTQHCMPPSLCPNWFSFVRKVNIIKNRCGWNRANSLFSVVSYVCMDFFPQITSSVLLKTAQQDPSKPCWPSTKQIGSREQEVQLQSRSKMPKKKGHQLRKLRNMWE